MGVGGGRKGGGGGSNIGFICGMVTIRPWSFNSVFVLSVTVFSLSSSERCVIHSISLLSNAAFFCADFCQVIDSVVLLIAFI